MFTEQAFNENLAALPVNSVLEFTGLPVKDSFKAYRRFVEKMVANRNKLRLGRYRVAFDQSNGYLCVKHTHK